MESAASALRRTLARGIALAQHVERDTHGLRAIRSLPPTAAWCYMSGETLALAVDRVNPSRVNEP
jgi:hypothetical protein